MTKPNNENDLPAPLRTKQAEPPKQEIITQPAARALNPFENDRKAVATSSSGNVEVQRAVAEVQAAIMLARQFPRDKVRAVDSILTDCMRSSLAESATYSYTRGGTEVTGPSIRLAEVLAANWGNFTYGWKETARRDGVSEVVAYAWDYESNVRVTREFTVKHWRDTKKGGYAIKDERDIYELCANQAARRMRACVLNIIPGDVIESAMEQCDRTLQSKEIVTVDSLKKLLSAFEGYGVSKSQIEKRIGRKLEAEGFPPAIIVSLRKIYNGLKDGMAKPEEFFDPEIPVQDATAEKAGAEGQGSTGARTGGANPPTGADEWDSAVEELIAGLNGARDTASLDAYLEECDDQLKKLTASGARGPATKWANALAKRREEVKSAT